METGKFDEAAELLAVYPILGPGRESIFYPLVFPRSLYLRGVLARERGDEAEAARQFRLFLQHAGEAPTIFGDAQKAREFIGPS